MFHGKCPQCGKEFKSKWKKTMCSFSCKGKAMPHPTRPPEERFWEKVTKTDTCWVWNAATNRGGYGQFRSGSEIGILAHRFSWSIHFGGIPNGLFVCHKCDNPPCVNPDHLFLGTHDDNIADAASKKRMAHGENSGPAKLRDYDVMKMREIRESGATYAEIATRFGVSPNTAKSAILGLTWKHLGHSSSKIWQSKLA